MATPWTGALACALALSAGAARAELPELTLGRVLREGAGGSVTAAMTAELDGRPVFVKSRTGSQRGTRYANLESDVLAHAIFTRLAMRCPAARIVRLSKTSTCRDRLGEVVQVMDLVDATWAKGKVFEGFWPTSELADVDQYAKLALVDVVIGNADRREPNLFVRVPVGGKPVHTPVPIDNNAGFGTMINWFVASEHLNFVKTYDGLGATPQLAELGTVRNVVKRSPVHMAVLGVPALEPRVLAAADELVKRLDDAWWGGVVDALPAEMLPPDLRIDPEREMPDASLPAGVPRAAFFGDLRADLPHAQLVVARKRELKDVFAWRRDRLREALKKYLAWRRVDPESRRQDAELQ
jgi:hypothetical protein